MVLEDLFVQINELTGLPAYLLIQVRNMDF